LGIGAISFKEWRFARPANPAASGGTTSVVTSLLRKICISLTVVGVRYFVRGQKRPGEVAVSDILG